MPESRSSPPSQAKSTSLYPAKSSAADVLEYAKAQLPVTNINDLLALMEMYANTKNGMAQHPEEHF